VQILIHWESAVITHTVCSLTNQSYLCGGLALCALSVTACLVTKLHCQHVCMGGAGSNVSKPPIIYDPLAPWSHEASIQQVQLLYAIWASGWCR